MLTRIPSRKVLTVTSVLGHNGKPTSCNKITRHSSKQLCAPQHPVHSQSPQDTSDRVTNTVICPHKENRWGPHVSKVRFGSSCQTPVPGYTGSTDRCALNTRKTETIFQVGRRSYQLFARCQCSERKIHVHPVANEGKQVTRTNFDMQNNLDLA